MRDAQNANEKLAQGNYEMYRERQQKHLDKGRKKMNLKIGDRVYEKVKGLVGTAKKWHPPYHGPFRVLDVKSDQLVVLDGGRNAGRPIHVQNLRRYIEGQPLKADPVLRVNRPVGNE